MLHHRSSFRLFLLAAAMSFVAAGPATGNDWFVKAGSSGDGSKDKPFGDPWEAFEKCEAGDSIHITEGKYTGKLQQGLWKVPFDGITVQGGYSADWTQRDPWKFKTQLYWDRSAKNYPLDGTISVNSKNVVIDGILFDMREQNEYVDEAGSGRTPKSLDTGKEAIRSVLPITIRNCVFLNTGREGIVCANGSTIENNLFLNTCDTAIKINGMPPANPDSKLPAIIKNNTFLWSWCDRAAGKGRYSGAAIQMSGHATITQNIFAHCDNNAIYCTINPEKTSITKNVFFMNLFSNFKMFVDGADVVVDDATMDLFEECGLKAFDGNQVGSPGMPLDPDWMDGTAKRTAGERGKVEMNDWNTLRQTLGLPLIGTGGKEATGIAPAYPQDKAFALLAPTKADLKAGARIVPVTVKFSGGAVAGPAKTYQKIDLTTWAKTPDTVDGKALEMTIALSSVGNIGSIPATYKKDDHEGIMIHDASGAERITAFYKKGSTANRIVSENAGNYNGSGKADRLFVVKGVAHATSGYPKAMFLIESITPFIATAEARKKATGSDWFIKAGASGGDGTREKPFRDPFQALERCEAGDTIHVTGGEYVGKLRAGTWRVDAPDITLLGGYNADFTARDPWKNPTLLYCPADFKGRRGGYVLEGAEDHTGCTLDGFVFDKKLNNQYDASGDLRYMESDKTEMVWFAKPDCVIRNCTFVNGAMGAVRAGSAQTIENCIFMNQHVQVVSVQRAFNPEQPFVFRNNTVAFAWEKRFGSGHGVTADLLMLGGGIRAVVDNNIFEFADQHAIRLDADPKDVELTNNVFAHNLWAQVYRTAGNLIVDTATFGQLKDLGFKKAENNVLMTPGLDIDAKWFDVYLNRTAFTPGKVQMDEWNQIREILGQPLIAAGAVAGTGLAPAYDYKKAVAVFPKNPACKAGARAVKLEVKFEGVPRPAPEEHEYAEVTWDIAKDANEWAKLEGQRVSITIAIKNEDNQWPLEEINKATHAVWQVGGPEGSNSPGLPMRVYVLRGTRFERVFKQAKGYTTGAVAETHILKGIVKKNRQLLVELVEKGG